MMTDHKTRMMNSIFADNIWQPMVVSNVTSFRQPQSGGYFGVWDLNSFSKDSKIRVQSFCLLYLIFIIIILAIGSKIILIWKIHFPESGLAIIVGAILSLMTHSIGYEDIANKFDGDFFFWFLLPPIVFQAGYAQDRDPFFSNWFSIMIFANFGTLMSMFVFGCSIYWLGVLNLSLPLNIMECLAFGALISSTDPVSTLSIFAELKVHPALRAIIYGSSAIDDAVSIVMFKAFQKYINVESLATDAIVAIIFYLIICVIASLIIGILFGSFTAWCMKSTKIRGEKKLIICVSVCLIYISYFMCTVLELSGIISCMFAAISFKYCLEFGEILTVSDFQALDLSFTALAYFLETFTFFAMGMSMGSSFLKKNDVDLRFVFWSLLLALVSRAAYVYPLSYITNYMNGKSVTWCCSSQQEDPEDADRPHLKIKHLDGGYDIYEKRHVNNEPQILSMNVQHMIVFAGLRGPIAYAAAQVYPTDTGHFQNIYFATTAVVLVNIFINGSLTKLALLFLNIDHIKNIDTAVQPLHTSPCTDVTGSRDGLTNNLTCSSSRAGVGTKGTSSVNDRDNIEERQLLDNTDSSPNSETKCVDRVSSKTSKTNIMTNVIREDKDIEAGDQNSVRTVVDDSKASPSRSLVANGKDMPDQIHDKKRTKSWQINNDNNDKCADNRGWEDSPEDGVKISSCKEKKKNSSIRCTASLDFEESLQLKWRRKDGISTRLFRKFERSIVVPLFRSDS